MTSGNNNLPEWEFAISDESVIGHEHFLRFKGKHRQRMLVERIEQRPHTRSNGHDVSETMQGFGHGGGHLPNSLPWTIRVREWLRRSFINQGWEHVVVNKQVDSITMPRWVASAILVAILGFGIQSWWARTNDHDTLVEIRTELRLAKEADAKKDLTMEGAIRDLDSWKDVMNGNMKEIKGMLSQQQINALEQLSKKNNQNSQQ